MTRVVVHLVSGASVRSSAEDHPESELNQLKEMLRTVMKSQPEDGWELHLETEGGGWAIFPRSAVLYVELVVDG